MVSVVESVSLTCKIDEYNALSISDDDQIAVISEVADLSGFLPDPYSNKTKGGVHILSCDGRPVRPSMHFAISKVETPVDLFLPTAVVPKNTKQFDDDVDLVFDQVLNATVRGKTPSTRELPTKLSNKWKNVDPDLMKPRTEQRGPRQATWSPKAAYKNGGCLLSVLWLDYRLVIFGDCSHGWNEVVDLSELWKTYMKDYVERKRSLPADAETKSLSDLMKLKQTCYMQAAVTVTWSSSYRSELEGNHSDDSSFTSKRLKSDCVDGSGNSTSPFCLLAVALKSGCIVLWKVQLPAIDKRNFQVCEFLDYGDSPANQLLFIPSGSSTVYLCQGNFNGVVLLHRLTLKSGSIDRMENETPLELWSDADKLAVTGLCWNSKSNILVGTKGHTVVVWQLDKLDSGHPTVVLRKAPAVSFDYGILCTVLTEDELIVACLDGTICKASLCHLDDISDSESFLPLQVLDCPWNSKELKINGMVSSRNGVFIVVALSPASYFCHLAQRKPSKVHLLCRASLAEVSTLVLNSTGSLQDVSDALTYLKWIWSTKRQWTDEIADMIDRKDKWETYSAYRLKLVRFLLKIQLLYWKDDETGKEACRNDLATIEEQIVYRHVKYSLGRLVQKDSLTTSELRTLSVMAEFLKKRGLSTDDAQYAKKLDEMFGIHPEVCAICKSQIVFSGHLKDSCPNQHSFSRCNQTLLLCDEVPYRCCNCCKHLAHAWKDTNESSGSTHNILMTNCCTFCDGMLV